ncbi:hypothetical protein AXF42_Ash011098 [Apostasia shenzhenica]|uniref:Uncharacterized protein n=1 Tax=Apostasia shenzhenica TaxID=1088818 RepID=A0A2I0AKT1_9ASPA|nr:hypothetical protein AXF42_Ash011098 [Apostasia shenzhenica]
MSVSASLSSPSIRFKFGRKVSYKDEHRIAHRIPVIAVRASNASNLGQTMRNSIKNVQSLLLVLLVIALMIVMAVGFAPPQQCLPGRQFCTPGKR